MNKRIRWLVAGWALASVVRRLSQRTGVTDAEAYGTLPGDDVIAHPMVEWTRGITVRATPERIWPWLVQMGYGRAGWYTPPGSTGSSSRPWTFVPQPLGAGPSRSRGQAWTSPADTLQPRGACPISPAGGDDPAARPRALRLHQRQTPLLVEPVAAV